MSGTINDTLIVDQNGMPTPQIVDEATKKFVSLMAKNGALKVDCANIPSDGVMPIKIIAPDGSAVGASNAGISVVLSDNTVNCQSFDGTQWYSQTGATNQIIIQKDTYSGTQAVSSDIRNNQCHNGFLLFNVESTANSITGVTIELKMGDTYIPYKTFTVAVGNGISVIPFGINDDKNKCVVPAMFRCIFTHASTTAFTYQVGLQLV